VTYPGVTFAIVAVLAAPARADKKPAVVLEQALAGRTAGLELLADTVRVGAVLWADPACERRFGHPSTVTGGDRAALLQCLLDADLVGIRWDSGAPIALGSHDGTTLVSVELIDRKIAALGAIATNADDAAMPTVLDRDVSFLFAGEAPTPLHAVAKACQTKTGALATTRIVRSSGVPAFDAGLIASAKSHRRANRIAVGTPPLAVCWIVPADEPPGGGPDQLSDEEPGTPPSPMPAQLVPPTVLEALRLSGAKAIPPDAATQAQIQRDHRDRIVASLKLCVDATGAVGDVTLVKSSGYPAYDTELHDTIATTWRYSPYLVLGKPVPVCTAVTFIYSP
jgi:hypothetical protein